MEVTLDDIARTLGASLVSLPGPPSRPMVYAGGPVPGPTSPPNLNPNTHPQYRYQTPQQLLPGDFNRLAVAGNPGPPIPPPHPFHHPHPHPHPHHPGFARPPHPASAPPPPPPPPRPGSHEAQVFRAVSPIPPSLLTGPRNIERSLA